INRVIVLGSRRFGRSEENECEGLGQSLPAIVVERFHVGGQGSQCQLARPRVVGRVVVSLCLLRGVRGERGERTGERDLRGNQRSVELLVRTLVRSENDGDYQHKDGTEPEENRTATPQKSTLQFSIGM